MKRPDLLLVSLTANALLVLALGWQLRPTSRPRQGEPAMSESAGVRPRNPAAVDRSQLGDPSLEPFGRQPIQWSRFSVGDWTRYRDELLACGCPRDTVREILQPLVDRSFNRRGRELIAPISARFWEFICPPVKNPMERVEKQFAALDSERRSVLDRLFPSGWVPAEPRATGIHPDERRAFLDPDKRQQVTAAEQNYEALVAEARATQPDGELVAQLIQQAASNREAEVARILTPEELAEFKVRSSPNSGWVRALEGIRLTETELVEIVRIRDRATASHNQPVAINPTEAAIEQAALGKLLGPERFEEFKRAKDGNYQQLVLLTRRLGLETAMAGSLWQTRRTFQEQAAALSGDRALSREQRQTALQELRFTQEQVVGHLLPEENARAAWNLQQAAWLKQTFVVPDENPLADWLKEP